MGKVILKNVYKFYEKNANPSVSNFNLEINDKEFIVFVGPSGCGKTTTLRMIAGLEEISAGDIYIDDLCVDNLEPKDRDIAMVFQDYALYPHMSVYENMAFGLRLKKIRVPKLDKDGKVMKDKTGRDIFINRSYTKQEIDEKVREAAKILEIESYLERKPKALSGGQRQRVAIGRAIVRTPKVFLMDEPLSNLDAKLRNQMRSELILLRKRIQTTFVYVTHDQTEAMTLGDRIVVMKDGFIQQIGTPKEVFNHPRNIFVATFIGAPQMNLINSKFETDYSLNLFGTKLNITNEMKASLKEKNINNLIDITVGIRPEHIVVDENGEFEGKVIVSEMMGTEYFVHLLVNDEKLVIKAPILNLNDSQINKIENNQKIKFSIDKKSIHIFDNATGLNLL